MHQSDGRGDRRAGQDGAADPGSSGLAVSRAAAGAAGAADYHELLARDCLEAVRQNVARISRMGVLSRGSACPQVLLLRGRLTERERAGAALLADRAGDALHASLDKLGYPADERAALSTLARQDAGPDGESRWGRLDPQDLAWAVEALDPEAVLCVDPQAAADLEAAWGQQPGWLEPGTVRRHRGRRALALGDFPSSLDDIADKRLMWGRLRLLPPLGEPA